MENQFKHENAAKLIKTLHCLNPKHDWQVKEERKSLHNIDNLDVYNTMQ